MNPGRSSARWPSLARFASGWKAALAAQYGRGILRWMKTPTFQMVVGRVHRAGGDRDHRVGVRASSAARSGLHPRPLEVRIPQRMRPVPYLPRHISAHPPSRLSATARRSARAGRDRRRRTDGLRVRGGVRRRGRQGRAARSRSDRRRRHGRQRGASPPGSRRVVPGLGGGARPEDGAPRLAGIPARLAGFRRGASTAGHPRRSRAAGRAGLHARRRRAGAPAAARVHGAARRRPRVLLADGPRALARSRASPRTAAIRTKGDALDPYRACIGLAAAAAAKGRARPRADRRSAASAPAGRRSRSRPTAA